MRTCLKMNLPSVLVTISLQRNVPSTAPVEGCHPQISLQIRPLLFFFLIVLVNKHTSSSAMLHTHATRLHFEWKGVYPPKGRNDKETSTQNRNSSEPLILVAHSVAVLVQLARKTHHKCAKDFLILKRWR